MQQMTQPLSESEWQSLRNHQKKIDKEHNEILLWRSHFISAFDQLENALAALLYTIININKSQIAYAIYFSSDGFFVRSEIVNNAIIQLIHENDVLAGLAGPWTKIFKQVDRSRSIRNTISHSSPLTICVNGKSHARLSPPAFDIIRVGRKIRGRQIPGLGSNEIKEGCRNTVNTQDRIDDVIRVVNSFYTEHESLGQRFHELEVGLKRAHNPTGHDANPTEQES